MNKAITVTKAACEAAYQRQMEALSSAIVLGSGAALILAGQAFPL